MKLSNLSKSSGLPGLQRTLLAAGIGLAAGAAQAADIYVDRGIGQNTPDCGSDIAPCRTIAHAVGDIVNDDDVVLLVGAENFKPRGVYVFNDITIRGLGRDNTRLDGGNVNRHFIVEAGAEVKLEALSLRRGNASNGCGGSVEVNDGRLEVLDVRFVDNSADCGGAVHIALGSLTVEDSEFNNNVARDSHGGAIFCESYLADDESNCDAVELFDSSFDGNLAARDGGALFSMATTLVRRSDFHANEGSYGGAIRFEPASDDELDIKRSQFSANEARYGGGVSANLGSLGGKVEVRRSAFDVNLADGGGAMYLAGTSLTPESVEIINSTFSANTANLFGGGIVGSASIYFSTFVDQVADPTYPQDLYGQFDLYRSLITKVDVAPGLDECNLPARNGASNLTDGTSCGSSVRLDAHDNSKLGRLGLWGGRTLSYRLISGSNAVNEADNCRGANGQLQVDQRGAERGALGGECDIGAYELQP